MEVRKEAGAGMVCAVDEREMEFINAQSRKRLEAGDVYTFGVRLCDNEVDRDGERFTGETLKKLAELFVGKSGIFDHQWSAKGQAARIYRTEVVEEGALKTEAGDSYCYLKGWAYMVRTEGNADLIAEIEGGIKKEVSVGCAVEKAMCSICGEDMGDRSKCAHVKGKQYGGKRCWADLVGATDAYEWSFVAVPAQKRAGVMKGKEALSRRAGEIRTERSEKTEGAKSPACFCADGGVIEPTGRRANRDSRGGEKEVELKEFLKGNPMYLAQVERLEEEAEAGRRYLGGLRSEVARLGRLAEPDMGAGVLAGIVDKLGEEELCQMKKAYEARLERKYPVGPQLRYESGKDEGSARDGAFLI